MSELFAWSNADVVASNTLPEEPGSDTRSPICAGENPGVSPSVKFDGANISEYGSFGAFVSYGLRACMAVRLFQEVRDSVVLQRTWV